MAEGKLKADKDYTKDVDKLLPETETIAQKDPQAAIEKLLSLEKQTRQASDLPSTSRILVAIVTICKNAGDWTLLNEQVTLLSKKHSQLRQAITKMVQVVMGFLDDTPNMEKKLSVIETLRTVTEGKIFVEVERARVTRILSDIKKQQGDLAAATDILCELQVETFGSMSRREKTEFILEQVSLCIEKGDWIQASILSRKISTRFFTRKPAKAKEQKEKEESEKKKKTQKSDNLGPAGVASGTAAAAVTASSDMQVDGEEDAKEDDVTDLKLRYYEQQIMLAKHEDKYLEACKHYRQVLDTEAVENNPDQLRACLQRIIYYAVLAPYDNEQSDLLHRVDKDIRNNELVPTEASLLKLFTQPELMRWPMVSQSFGPHLCSTDVFDAEEPAAGTKSTSTDDRAHVRWQDLRKRVIEHNVRVVAKYYTRIQFRRLTQLLDLDEDETEKYISDLVTSKTIYAKIDRPARIVSFKKTTDADEVLNEWSGNMHSLLGLLDVVDHLINKEEMMARIQVKS